MLGTFSSWGEEEPKTWLVLLWGALIGGVSVVLLIVGGLDALQWGAIVVASPFVLVLIAMCIGTIMDLVKDGYFRSPTSRRRASEPAAQRGERTEAP